MAEELESGMEGWNLVLTETSRPHPSLGPYILLQHCAHCAHIPPPINYSRIKTQTRQKCPRSKNIPSHPISQTLSPLPNSFPPPPNVGPPTPHTTLSECNPSPHLPPSPNRAHPREKHELRTLSKTATCNRPNTCSHR